MARRFTYVYTIPPAQYATIPLAPTQQIQPSPPAVLAKIDRPTRPTASQQSSAAIADLPKAIELTIDVPRTMGGSDVTEGEGKAIDFSGIQAVARKTAHEINERKFFTANEKLSASEKLGKEIAKAKRGDCRTEHAHMGILAIPLLMHDTVTDKGCKW